MHALIIGGGIAGTATALALHRAGISCEVHEARDRASDGTGAFLTLAVNGLSTLRTLGFDIDSVPGAPTTAMELALGDGRPLVRFPLGPELEVDGTPIVTRTVRRADLYRALREHITALGIPVHYNHRLTTVAPHHPPTPHQGTALDHSHSPDARPHTAVDHPDSPDAHVRTAADQPDSPHPHLGSAVTQSDSPDGRTGTAVDYTDSPSTSARTRIDYPHSLGAASGTTADYSDSPGARPRTAADHSGIPDGRTGTAVDYPGARGARGGGGVVARFANGDTASGDLLIGADGLHSRVRALIDAEAPAARYLGVLNTGGYAHGLDLGADAAPGVMRMMFGKRTFFSFLPSADGSVWWFANPPLAAEPERGSLDRDPERWRRTLLDLVADDDPLAARIVSASDELFAPWPTHDHPDVPTWHRGRLIIIGDAAHAASPSSGQGASMAIEDAAVLALALRDRAASPAPSDPAPDTPTVARAVPATDAGIARAFATYEELRRKRVARVVAQGKRNGSGKAPGPVGRVIRDAVMRVVFAASRRRLRRGTAKPPRIPTWPYTYPLTWPADLGGLPDDRTE